MYTHIHIAAVTLSAPFTYNGNFDLGSCDPIIPVLKSRKMRLAVHVERSLDRKVSYSVLVGKSEENRKLGKTGRRWEDNIQRDIQAVPWGGGDMQTELICSG
jgi:hypothetical protein